MKCLSSLIVFMIVLAVSPHLSAQYGTLTFRTDVGGPGVWNDGGTTTIYPGRHVAINIYATNAGGSEARITWSSPFSFTGSDGVTNVVWGDTALFPQTQFRNFWDTYRRTYAESWDGVLPDLFNFTGIGNNNGYPSGLGEIKILVCSLTVVSLTGTICIEQGDATNDTFDWLFDESAPPYPTFATVCWPVGFPDADHDGIADDIDNCPTAANPDQANTDGDSRGNVCDNCPTVANSTQTDTDSDGRGDACDNCRTVANADQADGDGDNVGNLCDNCPTISNTNQANPDGDPFGSACDNCPTVYNPDQADSNGNNIGDACDGFICGDVNNDRLVNIRDATYMICFLYKGGPAPHMLIAMDVNSDGRYNISDIAYLINYLYKTGPAPICG